MDPVLCRPYFSGKNPRQDISCTGKKESFLLSLVVSDFVTPGEIYIPSRCNVAYPGKKRVETTMTDNRKRNGGKAVNDVHKAANTAYDGARAGSNSRVTRTSGILTDALGISYQSVRFCDLDRFCDK
jgi:hypothetical protein